MTKIDWGSDTRNPDRMQESFLRGALSFLHPDRGVIRPTDRVIAEEFDAGRCAASQGIIRLTHDADPREIVRIHRQNRALKMQELAAKISAVAAE
jgi:hypothetical protein